MAPIPLNEPHGPCPPPGTRASRPHKAWHSRGYLPHLDHPGLIQSITFRLHDSVPRTIVEVWKVEVRWQEQLAADDPRAVELRNRVEQYEDAGHGECWLRRGDIAELVENALLHFDGVRYRLFAWCVMPNHVHVLCEPLQGNALDAIIHSWKSFTSKEANRKLRRSGRFWMEEYHDRYIRDDTHFASAKRYIEENPVRAGLVQSAEAWDWSSACRERVAGGTPAFPGGGTLGGE